MFGIEGSGLLESKILGSRQSGMFNQITSTLGLDAANSPVLLMLGDVKFSLNTAVMSQVTRSTEEIWAEAERINNLNTVQHTGPGLETLELPGLIYPDWKGAPETLDTLRKMQRAGEVYFLLAATGDVLGLFVIVSLRETRSSYKSNGDPSKIEFTLNLRRYAELASQKPSDADKEGGGLLGGVKKYAHKLTSGMADVESQVRDSTGDLSSDVRNFLGKGRSV